MENRNKTNRLIEISKAKIAEGIELSLKKSLEHLAGANALIDKNLLNDAVALIEFAIEEFGRAVYLSERLRLGLESIELSLEKGRNAHDLKYMKAFSVLPTDLRTVWEETIYGYFPKGYWGNYFPKGYWGGGFRKETISPLTRCDAVFIKFDEKTQSWHEGIMADNKKLTLIIASLRENIGIFKF